MQNTCLNHGICNHDTASKDFKSALKVKHLKSRVIWKSFMYHLICFKYNNSEKQNENRNLSHLYGAYHDSSRPHIVTLVVISNFNEIYFKTYFSRNAAIY